ncbi:MAG: PTS glucose/sucrose transporter subunit IIB [Bacillota bacterium]
MNQAQEIICALGGSENIKELDCCITRLRLVLKDPKLVDEKKLRAQGAIGVLKLGSVVQVVMGTTAELIENEMRKLMAGG